MRYFASILIALLVLADVAFGAVGDSGVSDSTTAAQPEQSYPAETAGGAISQSTGYQANGYQANGYQANGYQANGYQANGYQANGYQANGYQSYGYKAPQTDGSSGSASAYQGSSQTQGYSQQGNGYQQSQQGTAGYAANYGSNSYGTNYAASAPVIAGPYQERLSADDLKFNPPAAESFKPDASLDFASASPPSGVSIESYSTEQGNPGEEQGSWYYPGSVTSRNRFYVQTSSGFKTSSGCSYRGYLPIWSDINSAGNFYVYEWYPGQLTPSVRWWGWTWPGFKKGWFTGDVSGWHILSYNCRDWSNYIYIYVWPSSGAVYTSSPNGPNPAGTSAAQSAYLPAGAPTPPDPNAENLILPDFNLLQSSNSYQSQSGNIQGSYPIQSSSAQSNPAQGIYPIQGTASQQNSAQGGCTTCADKSFSQIQAAYYPMPNSIQSSYPAQSGCSACADKTGYAASYGAYTATSTATQGAAPLGYVAQTYQVVYPKPATYRLNEYYVQVYPGKLSTSASVKCGDWLPLWSKVGSPGAYWSFEWTQCGSPQVYCRPEVKGFGYKGTGWYQTWFRGNNPGWHILSYYNNDWSNYVYIYAWPT